MNLIYIPLEARDARAKCGPPGVVYMVSYRRGSSYRECDRNGSGSMLRGGVDFLVTVVAVRIYKFSEVHEAVPPGEGHSGQQKVIMGWSSRGTVDD